MTDSVGGVSALIAHGYSTEFSYRITLYKRMTDPTDPKIPSRPFHGHLYPAFEAIASETPTKPLYHYTTQDGFLGVWGRKALWASDLRFLNDAEEIRFGLRCVAQALIRKLESLSPLAVRTFADLPTNVGDTINVILATSFSAAPDRLSQWRAYGGNGPVALEFVPWSLPDIRDKNNAFLGPVLYRRDEQEELAEAVALDAWSAMSQLTDWPQAGTLPLDNQFEIAKAVVNAVLAAAFMKHPSFHEEQEWRLVAALDRGDQRLNFRTSRGLIVPYTEIALDKTALLRLQIVVGPCAHPKLLEEAIAMRMGLGAAEDRQPMGWSPKISHSKIPYRNW